MKKILLLLAATMVLGCTKDIHERSYAVKYHSDKLVGDFIAYDVNLGDTIYAKFIPNYLDTLANQSVNVLWLSTNTEPEAYLLTERIVSGISSYHVSRAPLHWNRDSETWDFGPWITYDIIDTLMVDGFVEYMETQREGSTSIWTFERI